MLHNLFLGLQALASPAAAGLLVLGTFVGVFFGVLPGLGVALVLSIMLAFVYHLPVAGAIALMLGTQAGSYFSASITAILLNSPGAPESMATTFDGFQMAEKGEAGRALGISATCTAIGGLVGCAVLLGLLQVVTYLPLVFHPPELMALIILAVVLTATLGTDTVTKAILSAAIGLMISFIGDDPVTGTYRYTFNIPSLFGGISVVGLALGLFAVPQMVFMYGARRSVASRGNNGAWEAKLSKQVLAGMGTALRHWFLLVRSALVGVVCGIVPGIGGFTANFLSYGIAQQTSKRGKEFGTGIPEGVIAPESSSLAKEAGSLVPAVGLGLPSGLGMVLFLAALAILGLQPGIGFVHAHPSLPYTMLWAVAIGGVLGTAMGLVAAPGLARVTRVRGPLLLPFIVGLAVVGAFAATTSMATVVEVLAFTFIGIAFRRLRYSLAALAVGLVLGPDLETDVYQTHQIFGWHFWNRPLTDILFALVILALVAQARQRRRQGSERRHEGRSGGAVKAGKKEYAFMELAVAAIILILSGIYVGMAVGYRSSARTLPLLIGSVAVVVAVIETGKATRTLAAERGRRPRLPDLLRRTHAARYQDAPVPVVTGGLAGPAVAGAAQLMGGGSAQPVAAPTVTAVTEARGQSSERQEDDPVEAGPEGGAFGVAPTLNQVAVTKSAEEESAQERRTRYRREVLAISWAILFVLAGYVLGFLVGIPLIVFAYGILGSGVKRLRSRVVFAVVSALVMTGVTVGMFNVLHLTYSGLLNL